MEFVKSLLFHENIKTLANDSQSHESALATRKFHARTDNKSRITCFECGDVGHKKWECKLRRSSNQTYSRNSDKRNGTDKMNSVATFAVANFSTSNSWLQDSGATTHITGQKDYLRDFDDNCNSNVEIADGSQLRCTGKGTLEIQTQQGLVVTVTDVVHAPDV